MIDSKRCIEEFKPEGFRVRELGNYMTIEFCNVEYYKNYDLNSDDWIYNKYGDFLQRVIEEINLIPDRWIDIKLEPDTGGSCAWRPRVDLNWISDKVYLDIDQAKEQAINYILGEIK